MGSVKMGLSWCEGVKELNGNGLKTKRIWYTIHIEVGWWWDGGEMEEEERSHGGGTEARFGIKTGRTSRKDGLEVGRR